MCPSDRRQATLAVSAATKSLATLVIIERESFEKKQTKSLEN